MRIEIISGSARSGSVTKRVALHLVHRFQKTNVSVGFISMDDHLLPPVQNVWNNPQDARPESQSVAQRIFDADAILLVTPEYNGSYSPSLKNFIDHFPKLERKVFGIVSASPGKLGGIRAALQLQNLVSGIMGIGLPQMLIVPEVDQKFDDSGELLECNFENSIKSFQDEFLWLSGAIHYAKLLGGKRPEASLVRSFQ